MTKYYHATPYENLSSVMDQGILRGYDHVVYLTNSPESAASFLYIRGCKDILVLEISLEEELIRESHDHSEQFFKCKAYTYPENIDLNRINRFIRYNLEENNNE